MPKTKKKSPVKRRADDAERKRATREDESHRQTDRTSNAESMRRTRQDVSYRDIENVQRAESSRRARGDPDYREAKNAASAESMRKAREDSDFRQTERARNSEAMRSSRERDDFREPEKCRDNARKRKAREDPVTGMRVREANTSSKRIRTQLFNDDFQALFEKFSQLIQHSPSVICSCCGCLWFEESTTSTSRQKILEAGIAEEFLPKILCLDLENPRLCSTCQRYVSKSKIPRLALSNGFAFPDIPDVIKNLSPLEERLVSARIPFMQIRLRGAEQQSTISGNVVNVENDIVLCTKAIPRPSNETGTIQVQLMRRMQYKTPYMEERIRPFAVHQAANYLVSTPLYVQEGIVICNKWQHRREEETDSFTLDTEPGNDVQAYSAGSDEIDEPTHELDLQSCDDSFLFIENEVQFRGVRIAPGEANVPIPFFKDKLGKDLSFIKIRGGEISEYKIRVSSTDIAKSELRRYDRRACYATHIFWLFKQILSERVSSAAQIAIRQRSGAVKITAQNAKSPEYLRSLLERDDGYAIFRNIRSSPCYWKYQQKKVLGMIRQLGIPTFFITVSAAETRWPELLKALHEIVKGEEISEEEALNLSFQEKTQLIRKDPVTCMLSYEHRFRALLKTLLKPPGGILSPFKLSDFFTRVEFQLRGSPHTHGMYWIKDAPVFEEGCKSSEKACIDFVDQFITCKRDEFGEIKDLLSRQLHTHSHTCYKRNRSKKKCRFGFPKPPMPATKILVPLDTKKEAKALISKYTETYESIQQKLTEWGRSYDHDMDFNEFLDLLNINMEDYIMAVRSSIRSTTVFLRRGTSEAFINPYNKKLLIAWKANIDFQFILDPYACAKYCVGYIMKAEGGVSKLLQAVAQEVKSGNLTAKEQMKKFAKVICHGSEISTQEAVGFILGLPNTISSRSDVFINTSEPLKRIGMLKPQDELSTLEDDSNDIFAKGLIDHYVNRPAELKHECLANFAAMYHYAQGGNKSHKNCTVGDLEDSDVLHMPTCDEELLTTHTSTEDEDDYEGSRYMLLDGSGYMRRRKQAKVIRFRNFKKDMDEKMFCRERLMLFKPWQNEEAELTNIDVVAEFGKWETLIAANSKNFFYYPEDQHIRLVNMFSELAAEDDDESGTRCEFANEQDIQMDEDEMCGEFDRKRPRQKVENFRPPKMVDEIQYSYLMRSLNDKQRRFVLQTMHKLRTSNEPFYYFLSGGAGVGKSHVIHAIVQSCLRNDFNHPSEHPNQAPVIVCAPTGKAAFNVMGMTLHCVFKLPPNQATKFSKLNPDSINTLRMLLGNARLFIIDEISMTSQAHLSQIDQRLQQIYGNNLYFGGKPVIVVGHLRQLPPVMALYPFETTQSDADIIVGNILWEQFKLFELEEIMRQRGEHEFCEALNNMAEGTMTRHDINLIRSREISDANTAPGNAFRLFHSNQQCIEFNQSFHETLSTDGAWAIAYDRVIGKNVSKQQMEYYAEEAKTFSASKAEGLPYKTHLQVGANYFVSANVDVGDGLFNGSTGTLRHIEYAHNSLHELIPVTAWIEFHDSMVGGISRSKTRIYQEQHNIDLSWTSIKRIKKSLNLGAKYRGLELIREQIPIVAADALTINKAQGSSLPTVVVCVKPHKGKKLSRSLLYVGCSRATSLNGLFIDGNFVPPKPPKHNDLVTLEMNRLRSQPFTFNLTFLQDYGSDFTTLYFMNVQYVMKHHPDISSDLCPMSATFLGLVEPHILPHDNISFDGFNTAYRSDSSNRQYSDGSLVFVNKDIPAINVSPYYFATKSKVLISLSKSVCSFVRLCVRAIS